MTSCFVQGQNSDVVMLDFVTLFYEVTISVSDIKINVHTSKMKGGNKED